MSTNALDWAINVRVGHALSKSVLIVLASYADQDNGCGPRIDRLARETELSPAGVVACLDLLEARGLIARRPGPHVGGGDRFELLMPRAVMRGGAAR